MCLEDDLLFLSFKLQRVCAGKPSADKLINTDHDMETPKVSKFVGIEK